MVKLKTVKPKADSSRNANNWLPYDEDSNAISQTQEILLQNSNEQVLLDCIQKSIDFKDPLFQDKFMEIKRLFVQRDFNALFTNQRLLPIYCAEYLAGRALCYRDVFIKFKALRNILEEGRILSLGSGNGAELLGIGAAMFNTTGKVSIDIQDLSDYNIIPRLFQSIIDFYSLHDQISYSLKLGDLLDEFKAMSFRDYDLITACFILNEILSTSKQGFVRLVKKLLSEMGQGALLLVIDSAGSFSECNIGNNSAPYMLFKLMDVIKDLKIVESHDSVWYRFPPGLSYPIKINNMRFFVRLYKRK